MKVFFFLFFDLEEAKTGSKRSEGNDEREYRMRWGEKGGKRQKQKKYRKERDGKDGFAFGKEANE